MTIFEVPPGALRKFFSDSIQSLKTLNNSWVTYPKYRPLLGTKSVKMVIFGSTPRPKSTKFYKFLIAYDTVQRSLNNVLLVSGPYLLPFRRR